MTQDDSTDLGPKPAAAIEPGEVNPGGPDAMPAEEIDPQAEVPDLPSGSNPAVDDKTPDSMKDSLAEAEDTSTKATDGEEPGDGDPEEESPA